MFKIDTGAAPQKPFSFGNNALTGDSGISIQNPQHAIKYKTRLIEEIWSVDTPEQLEAVILSNDMTLDGLCITFPDYVAEIEAARKECLQLLQTPSLAAPSNAGALTQSKTGKVF